MKDLLGFGTSCCHSDFYTIHNYLQNFNYYESPLYIYLPSFLVFIPLWKWTTYETFKKLIWIPTLISLIGFIQARKYLKIFDMVLIFIFYIIGFCVDIDRGNTNILIFGLAIYSIIFLEKFNKLNKKIYYYIPAIFLAIATYKINFILFIIPILCWYKEKYGSLNMLKYIILILLIVIIIDGVWFILVPNQLSGYITNVSLKQNKLNTLFESNQIYWIILGYFWYLGKKLNKQLIHKILRYLTEIGIIFIIFLIKYLESV
ncbi:MAG: hypothetical protein ACTSO2_12255 [Promethearchaeota archaeon]